MIERREMEREIYLDQYSSRNEILYGTFDHNWICFSMVGNRLLPGYMRLDIQFQLIKEVFKW